MSDFGTVEALALAGKKIHAIKELRTLTGLGLREAKDAVEHFQAHHAWPAGIGRDAPPPPKSSPPSPPSARLSAGRLEPIAELVRKGQKISAIKELRTITGWGLKESKGAVDHYQRHGTWAPAVLAMLDGAPVEPTPPPRTKAAPPSGDDPIRQVLAEHLGFAPEIRLSVRARRPPQDGQLVMLGDRACFVRRDGPRWVVELSLPYDTVGHAEIHTSQTTVLYVSAGHAHERFELEPDAAEAALALFRVLAR